MSENNSQLKLFPLLIVGLLLSGLFSCRSSQELIYMNNTFDNEMLYTLKDTLTEYYIKPGDILYVSI